MKFDLFIKYSLICISLNLYLILSSCASGYQAVPEGGDDDKTAPVITEVFPNPGSVKQPRDLAITFKFSEFVKYSTTASAISISPLSVKEKAEIDWSEKKLDINFNELDSNQTVLVILKTSLTDQRGNKLSDNFILPFSTGERLDSAVFSGLVYDAIVNNDFRNLPSGLVTVQLFKNSDVLDSGLFKSKPEYEFGLDEKNKFEVGYLSTGNFLPMISHDKNSNGKLDLDQDEIFTVGEQTVGLTSGKKYYSEFIPGILDTIQPYIKEVKVITADLLSVQFSEPVLHNEVTVDSVILQNRNVYKASYQNSSGKDKITIQTDSLLKNSEILVHLSSFKDLYGNKSSIQGQSKRFLSPDSLPVFKTVLQNSLSASVNLDDTLRISLNRPDLPFFSIHLAESKEASPYKDVTSNCLKEPFLYKLPLESTNLSSGDYRCLVKAGTDTIYLNKINITPKIGRGTLSGKIIKPDSVTCNILVKPLKPIGSSRLIQEKKSNFKITLSPGVYRLAAYLDLNRDGQYNPGGLKNNLYSEPALMFNDTIQIRKNWEQSGFDLNFGSKLK